MQTHVACDGCVLGTSYRILVNPLPGISLVQFYHDYAIRLSVHDIASYSAARRCILRTGTVSETGALQICAELEPLQATSS